MATFSFIKENDSTATTWLAINSNSVKTLRICETYDRYGQEVSHYDAGDNIELNSDKAVEIANRVGREGDSDATFEVGDYVSAYDNSDIFDDVYEALQNEASEEDYTEFFDTVEGFNFFNGSNWQTITVRDDFNEPTHELCDDQALIDRMNKAIEVMNFVKEENGKRFFETEDFEIVESAWASDFEAYQITEK